MFVSLQTKKSSASFCHFSEVKPLLHGRSRPPQQQTVDFWVAFLVFANFLCALFFSALRKRVLLGGICYFFQFFSKKNTNVLGHLSSTKRFGPKKCQIFCTSGRPPKPSIFAPEITRSAHSSWGVVLSQAQFHLGQNAGNAAWWPLGSGFGRLAAVVPGDNYFVQKLSSLVGKDLLLLKIFWKDFKAPL